MSLPDVGITWNIPNVMHGHLLAAFGRFFSAQKRDVINVAEILRDVRELIDKMMSSPGAKSTGAFTLAVLHWLYGDLNPIHLAMAALILADWATGLTYALMLPGFNSGKALRGVIKLGMYAVLFVVSAQVDRVQVIGPLLSGGLLSTMIFTEAVSVLENLDKIARHAGVDMPILRPLIERLSQNRDAEDGGQ